MGRRWTDIEDDADPRIGSPRAARPGNGGAHHRPDVLRGTDAGITYRLRAGVPPETADHSTGSVMRLLRRDDEV